MNPWRHAEWFPLGEQTLVVRLGRAERIENRTMRRTIQPADGEPDGREAVMAVRAVSALAAKIRAEAPPGLLELVPAGSALAIHFDPLASGAGEWQARIERWLGQLDAPDGESGRLVEIPVCYGGAFGPDLDDVARRTGRSAEEVVRLHAGTEYVVGMIGFAPGFPYLFGLPRELAVPRREEPRTKVPAGSVAIGGGYAGIYPKELPGGWHIIGRTPSVLFDPAASPPSLLAPGDRVRFVPVDEGEFRRLAGKRDGGSGGWRAVRSVERQAVGAAATAGSGSGERTGGPSGRASGARPGLAGSAAPSGPSGETGGAVAGFRVIRPGLHTVLQDFGRPGFQRYGVTPGGAMDRISCRLANRLVGNRFGEPALEMTLAGPELEALADLVIAFCGADMEAAVNGRPIPAGSPVRVKAGDIVRFGAARAGCRAYLAVAGGFAAPSLLGGRGACPAAGLPGLLGRALAAGDRLDVVRRSGGPFGGCGSCASGNAGPGDAEPGNTGARDAGTRDAECADAGSGGETGSGEAGRASVGPATGRTGAGQTETGVGPRAGRLFPWRAAPPVTLLRAGRPVAVRVLPGPEFGLLPPEAAASLLERVHEVDSRSDRMGLRLTGGEPIPLDIAGIASEPVAWGTVQLPPGGRPIVLAADRQTTGGYPRVLQVIAADLPLIGQLAPGMRLVFQMVGPEVAAAALEEQERRMRLLEWAIDQKIGG